VEGSHAPRSSLLANSIIFTSPALLADGSSLSSDFSPIAAIKHRIHLSALFIQAFLVACLIGFGLQMTIRFPLRAPRHLAFASSLAS
jgi:hypothetical protein